MSAFTRDKHRDAQVERRLNAVEHFLGKAPIKLQGLVVGIVCSFCGWFLCCRSCSLLFCVSLGDSVQGHHLCPGFTQTVRVSGVCVRAPVNDLYRGLAGTRVVLNFITMCMAQFLIISLRLIEKYRWVCSTVG